MMRWRVLLLLAAAPQAHAQAVYGIGVASQYSVRGVTLSNGPVPQLSIDWDGDHGSFAGALLTRAHLHYAPSGLAAVAYGGAARRLGAGFSAELGAAAARFQHAARYNYHELFAGVAWERVSARLYHSPHYYGAGGRSVYGELNGSVALGEASTLTLHAGRLEARAGGGGYYGTPAQARSDFHVGLTTVLDGWTVHLAFRAVRGDASPYAAGTRRQGWEGGILRYF